MKEIAYLHDFNATDESGELRFVDIFIIRENGNTETHVFNEYENDYSDANFLEEEQTAWLEEARFIPIPDKELASISVTIDQAQSVIHDIIRGTYGTVPIPNDPYLTSDEDSITERDDLQLQYFNAVFVHELQNLVIKQCGPLTPRRK